LNNQVFYKLLNISDFLNNFTEYNSTLENITSNILNSGARFRNIDVIKIEDTTYIQNGDANTHREILSSFFYNEKENKIGNYFYNYNLQPYNNLNL
jgi:hypothetical protein